MILKVSDQLTLREITLQDAALVYHALDTYREDLRTWLPFVDRMKDVSDEEAFLSSQLSVPYEDRNLVFAIEKETRFCGLIGFVLTDRTNHKTEIGYWIIPPFRKQGIVKACVKYLCQWCFVEKEIHRIQIRCAIGNEASNAIPRRLGFSLEGVERDGELLVDGVYTDINVYSLLKNEWNQKAENSGFESQPH